MTPSRLLSIPLAAAELDIDPDELRSAIAAGRFPHYLIGDGRVGLEDLDLWPPENWDGAVYGRYCVGSIYFIGDAERSPIKIGWAMDPERRRRVLQAGCWIPLVVHGQVAGTLSEEHAVHRRMAPYRVQGEWFDRGAALDLLRTLEGIT